MRGRKMAKRNAAGAGSIRKKAVLRDGREYVYWEARLTVGVDPGTGKADPPQLLRQDAEGSP